MVPPNSACSAQSVATPAVKYLARSINALAVLTILLTVLSVTLVFINWNLEDGYIVYRIVHNLLSGDGWSYNVGEVHNASTSVLNTLLIALAAIPLADIPLAAHLVGSVSLCVVALSIFQSFRAYIGPLWALATALLTVEQLANSAAWGLESFLLLALVCVAVRYWETGRNAWPILALAILARPDAILFAAMGWLYKALAHREAPLSERFSIRGLMQCFLILAPWILFSLVTFGQVFPETLSNKIWQGQSGFWGRGWIYLSALMQHLSERGNAQLIVYIVALIGAALWAYRRIAWFGLIAFAVIQQVIYAWLNVPAYHWYFVILDAAAIMAACFAVGCALRALVRIVTNYTKRFDLLNCCPNQAECLFESIGVLALLVWSAIALNRAPANMIEDSGNRHYLAAAKVLASSNIPNGALATLEVGTLGFHLLNRPILDLIGLTSANPEFLSGKNNKLFFKNLPAIVLVHRQLWSMEKALVSDPEFKRYFDGPFEIATPYIPLEYYLVSAR